MWTGYVFCRSCRAKYRQTISLFQIIYETDDLLIATGGSYEIVATHGM